MEQLNLFDAPSSDHIQSALYRYPVITVFENGLTSGIYTITATSAREAEQIAEAMVRRKGAAFRRCHSPVSTYGYHTLEGWPVCRLTKVEHFS
jgi:hypothetical protein